MLDVMGGGDEVEIDQDEGEAEQTISAPTSSAPATAAPAVVNRNPKKVVDDWDAGEDALADEEKKGDGNGDGTAEGDQAEYEKLKVIYKAFAKLSTEFDTKFRAIWA